MSRYTASKRADKMPKWLEVQISDEEISEREKRRERIKKKKEAKAKYIKDKKLGHEAVKTRQRKKKMLEEAGK